MIFIYVTIFTAISSQPRTGCLSYINDSCEVFELFSDLKYNTEIDFQQSFRLINGDFTASCKVGDIERIEYDNDLKIIKAMTCEKALEDDGCKRYVNDDCVICDQYIQTSNEELLKKPCYISEMEIVKECVRYSLKNRNCLQCEKSHILNVTENSCYLKELNQTFENCSKIIDIQDKNESDSIIMDTETK